MNRKPSSPCFNTPIEKWDYQSLYAIASDPKSNKTIANNTTVELVSTMDYMGWAIYVRLHGNVIARVAYDSKLNQCFIQLCRGAMEWITYTTQTRLQKLMIDNQQDGIAREKGKWIRYHIDY